MIRNALAVDGFVARTRPAWAWLGEVAVAWLGVHLAADQLDDLLGGWLAGCGVAWPEPEQPLVAGTWAAVLVELLVAGWLLWARGRLGSDGVRGRREWAKRASVEAVLAPLAFLVFGLAGSWVMAMAVEDGVAPWSEVASAPLGALVGLAVAGRLALPAAWRAALAPPEVRRRWTGAPAAPPVLLLVALAARHGLPIWGFWP